MSFLELDFRVGNEIQRVTDSAVWKGVIKSVTEDRVTIRWTWRNENQDPYQDSYYKDTDYNGEWKILSYDREEIHELTGYDS
jgi:hypothetical protein